MVHSASSKLNKTIRYELQVFEDFLATLGNPQTQLPPVIHIAGTNGKGSVTTYLSSALHANGLNVGTYTSPHLVSYTERFGYNGSPMSESDLDTLLKTIQAHPGAETLTEFEVLTAAAFHYFAQLNMGKKIDILILEVGLGGRLDATNVIHPILSIITKIGLDHQAILGNTLKKIAQEKAGIIKPKVPVITLKAQAPPVKKVLREATQKAKSPLTEVAALHQIPPHYAMQGDYQKQNLALAKAALKMLHMTEKGLAEAQIWGRLQSLPHPSRTFLVDAAHNVAGINALLSHLAHHYPGSRPTFVVGIYAPKNAPAMLKRLLAYGQVVYCEFDPVLAWPYAKVAQLHPEIQSYTLGTPLDAISGDLVVITGSIYFLGKLKESNTHPPYRF